MASTTEELSSQSEQLVSALAFFRTGDDGGHAAVRHVARPAERHAEAPARPAKAAVHAAGSGKAMAAKAGAGVNLRLKDKDRDRNIDKDNKPDDLDKEFEGSSSQRRFWQRTKARDQGIAERLQRAELQASKRGVDL